MNSRLRYSAVTLLLALTFVHAEQSPSVSLQGRLQAQTGADATFYFPDYVDGGGWSVQLVLLNTAATTSAQAVVAVYDQNGETVDDLFSRSNISIPSLGIHVLRSRGNGTIRRGWITVEADTPSVSGLLTYRHNESGIEVGVEPAELATRFALFVESTSDIGTGFAVFKGKRSSSIELRIRDADGQDPLNGEVIEWDNFYQRALTIPEWLRSDEGNKAFLGDFRGLLFVQSADGAPIGVLGLRFGKTKPSLSAVPVVELATADDCPAPNPFGGCDPTDPTTSPSRPAAPTVSAVQDEPEELKISFRDSFRANETKAYDVQVRTKSPRGNWAAGCTTVTNPRNAAGTGTVSITARGLNPDTVYEARYRHRNSSRCGGGTPGEWSEIGEGRTGSAGTDPPPDNGSDFETLSGFKVRSDGGITLSVGGITQSVGKGGCIVGGGTFNGQTWDYHQTWWQRDTGSGWQDVSNSKKTGRLCGYDLSSAPSGKYRAVGDMTVAGTRGNYKSENEVSK